MSAEAWRNLILERIDLIFNKYQSSNLFESEKSAQQVIEKHFPHLLSTQINPKNEEKPNLAEYIDHTLLKPVSKASEIETLCKEAIQNQFYAVCVNASRVPQAASILKDSGRKLAAVVGFPLGAMSTESKAHESQWTISHGASEIDMVRPKRKNYKPQKKNKRNIRLFFSRSIKFQFFIFVSCLTGHEHWLFPGWKLRVRFPGHTLRGSGIEARHHQGDSRDELPARGLAGDRCVHSILLGRSSFCENEHGIHGRRSQGPNRATHESCRGRQAQSQSQRRHQNIRPSRRIC